MADGTRQDVLIVAGTRPEAVKLASVARALAHSSTLQPLLLTTGQHPSEPREMLADFDLTPDIELSVERGEGTTLSDLLAQLVERIGDEIQRRRPAAVLVQGDTSSTLAGGLAGFYEGVPVGHIEAGLRTGLLSAPFPEEGHRQMVARVCRWHFAPTELAARTLVSEAIPSEQVHMTGNTVIDAIQFIVRDIPRPAGGARRRILVTAHRRENWGQPMQRICAALNLLARRDDVELRIVVHPNPTLQELFERELGGRDHVVLMSPLPYRELARELVHSSIVLTDSGGLQEEAPALAKPVLVMRDVTERPEVIEAGVGELVGTDSDRIVAAAERLLDDAEAYEAMTRAVSPYGDGHAAERIVSILEHDLAPSG
ncbi:MAG: UDP-N-acetylglucosamine 2-epimerase (non-hydrolyzing) [Dehalococcoidia bacterium]|nr:UDP-N-acetylglucosamine 2-epimerase (non-hydrolyzing) [Dehalococcoidia bacterium]